MCCSPKAAVSISEDINCVVESDRKGTRTGCERAGTSLRRDAEELLDSMATDFILVEISVVLLVGILVAMVPLESRDQLIVCGPIDQTDVASLFLSPTVGALYALHAFHMHLMCPIHIANAVFAVLCI